MFKWLNGKGESFEPGSRDFKMIAESVHADAMKHIGILGEKSEAKTASAAKHAVGVSKGIDEGDYFH